MTKRTKRKFLLLFIIVIFILVKTDVIKTNFFTDVKKSINALKDNFQEVKDFIINDICNTSQTSTDNEKKLPTESSTEISVYEAMDGFFEIHFLDVGQADAALVLCDNQVMLIDGGNIDDSSFIYAYLKEHEINYLDYVVCTHPHEDHVGGLSGALNYAKAGVIYCPVTEFTENNCFDYFLKYIGKQGLQITVPSAGDVFSLGAATVTVLGPVKIKEGEDINNASIVLRIEYGATSFLFTGDAEREAEERLLNAGCKLESTVLKVGHHGSSSSTTYPFLREVMPEYAIISVGKGNEYGHPTDSVLSKLKDAGATVYRTDERGTIICTSNGVDVNFRFE